MYEYLDQESQESQYCIKQDPIENVLFIILYDENCTMNIHLQWARRSCDIKSLNGAHFLKYSHQKAIRAIVS